MRKPCQPCQLCHLQEGDGNETEKRNYDRNQWNCPKRAEAGDN